MKIELSKKDKRIISIALIDLTMRMIFLILGIFSMIGLTFSLFSFFEPKVFLVIYNLTSLVDRSIYIWITICFFFLVWLCMGSFYGFNIEDLEDKKKDEPS